MLELAWNCVNDLLSELLELVVLLLDYCFVARRSCLDFSLFVFCCLLIFVD